MIYRDRVKSFGTALFSAPTRSLILVASNTLHCDTLNLIRKPKNQSLKVEICILKPIS